jgi:alkanesulfonate monooxygenase SsuD/methylene tetrahydromethanopterin reductase-like flavin-dependent oxidoreductase (luciferase family)
MVEHVATEVRWQDRRFHVPIERIALCEELGYDAVVTAEGDGSDALTPLGYVAARTGRGWRWRLTGVVENRPFIG